MPVLRRFLSPCLWLLMLGRLRFSVGNSVPLSGHCSFFLQLQCCCSSWFGRAALEIVFLLCDDMMDFYVRHAGVAYFQSVFIEYFVQWVVFVEAYLDCV